MMALRLYQFGIYHIIYPIEFTHLYSLYYILEKQSRVFYAKRKYSAISEITTIPAYYLFTRQYPSHLLPFINSLSSVSPPPLSALYLPGRYI